MNSAHQILMRQSDMLVLIICAKHFLGCTVSSGKLGFRIGHEWVNWSKNKPLHRISWIRSQALTVAVIKEFLGNTKAGNYPRTPENGFVCLPYPFIRGAMGADVPFYKSIMGNFMVYQDPFEINLLQLLAHLQPSEWFSIISGTIFEVNLVAEQKQA